MKKSLFLCTAGVAGMLLCTPQSNANAEVNVNINLGGGPAVVAHRTPDFIYLNDYGFAVSWGWDYDVINYGKYYFIYRDGRWYRSSYFRGPWARVSYRNLPGEIRRHNWNDIRRRRDREYRRYDRTYWERHFREQRVRDRRDDHGGRPDGRPDFRPDGRPDGRPDFRPDGRPDGRPDFRPDGRPDSRPDGRP